MHWNRIVIEFLKTILIQPLRLVNADYNDLNDTQHNIERQLNVTRQAISDRLSAIVNIENAHTYDR